MRRSVLTILFGATLVSVVAVAARGGGFDGAIEAASLRVVKLHGLGAGIQEGYGSGVVVSRDGLVVTVLSLLIEARVVTAIAHDGTRYEVEVVSRDSDRQLALLQLKHQNVETSKSQNVEKSSLRDPGAPGSEQQHWGEVNGRDSNRGVGLLPFFDLQREALLSPGDWVLAAGNPFKIAGGAEPVSIAHGVFSGRTRLDARRRVKDFPYRGEVLVIDAVTSNPGAPGGALVNLDGTLVGMIGRVVLSNMTHTHFNYAIPRDVLHAFVLETTTPSSADAAATKRHAGDTFTALDPGIRLARTGYRTVLPFVERVQRASAAARAGVQKDDLILSFNGKAVPDVVAYDKQLGRLSPHEPIELVIRRGRTILSIQLHETSKSQNVKTSKWGDADTEADTDAPSRDRSEPSRDREGAGGVAIRPTAGSSDKGCRGDADCELLHATQDVFRTVARKLRPCLVRIHTVGGSQPHGVTPRTGERDDGTPPPSPFRDSAGSSFVVADGATTGLTYSPDGYIITSSFNFVREPMLISVTLPDGRRLAADLIARDQVRKIALLKVDAADLPVPEWVDVDDLRVGQWAIALGQGFAGPDPFVTVGIVSALNRMWGNAVQTDAKLSPANYGGPLCDMSGRVIGICVPMAQRPGELAGIEMYDSGVGFAVPRRRVDEIVTTLVTGRSFYRGWLGISANPHALDGVGIVNVAIPSPMHAAGVQPGDVIIGARDREIHSYSHLMKALYMIPAGEQVVLQLVRDDAEYSAVVTLEKATELGQFPDLPRPDNQPEE